MPNIKPRWIVLGVITLFMGLVATVVLLRMTNVIGFQVAMLMLAALLGLYVGIGILVAVYRFMSTLE
jgi:hypothetical protein